MDHRDVEHAGKRRLWPWIALALLALGGVGGCGTDLPPYSKDCCVNGSLYYICTDELSAGQCLAHPQNPSGCTYQLGLLCPGSPVP